jgi:hypothetical protein
MTVAPELLQHHIQTLIADVENFLGLDQGCGSGT